MGKQISLKIHPQYSVVGLMGQNSFQDGDEITEDWILHKDGTKTPLWVKSISQMSMKAPVLHDIKVLEARVHPLLQKVREKLNQEDPRYDLLRGKRVSGEYEGCTYKYDPKDGVTEVLFSERKTRSMNKALLPVVHGIMKTIRNLSRRLMKLQGLLYGELERACMNQFRDRVYRDRQYFSAILKVNGRSYLLNPSSGRVGGFYVAGIVEDLLTVTL